MRIYVAGPYTNGDVAVNVRVAIETADELLDKGHTPYVPHLTHFWHLVRPRPYHEWLELDRAWLAQSEGVFRCLGYSEGADKEIAYAHELGLPVWERMEDVP